MDYIGLIKELAPDAIRENDHLVLKSGRHATIYVQKGLIGKVPRLVTKLTDPIVNHFSTANIEVVVALASGAIPFGEAIATKLTATQDREIPCIIAHKNDQGEFEFRNGDHELLRGKNVLIAEDVSTTGGSSQRAIKTVTSAEGRVAGLSFIWIRGGQKVIDRFKGFNLFSTIMHEYPDFTREQCAEYGPCAKGIPINTELGHGAAFVAEHGQPVAR